MTTINLDIPEHLKTKILIKSWNHINIIDLFNMFWVDLNYVIEERKYSQEYLNDIKNNDFVINSKF